jgi:hypothetical protein
MARGFALIFQYKEMKDRDAETAVSRQRLVRLMPDLASILPGSLLSRMVHCNKPGCQYCEKGKGKGHGPIRIISVSLGNRRVRQVPVPDELRTEVEQGQRAFAQAQKLLKQIAMVNLEMLKERKRRG